ncbi:hypothetical protein K5P26_06545 [Sphingopyxis sp. XHP0097]|uniref:Uncharacterized protein n=1 Tax=Sphingopyxis jiangsuensis TaxID=2871171 RepID=A0ABS7MD78_9SPHN|nr:hypothetical protein [Sphingopyxis jiangsuensis]MBY4636798.1 hypothetical protein [Sphingopyxis jiangsuensis]
MIDNGETNRLRAIWQSNEAELDALSLDAVRERAARLGSAVERRNRREYGAAAIVVVMFALYAAVLPGLLLKLGSLLTIAAALFVAWQLSRRTSRSNPDAEMCDIRAFYRARLAREEYMLARVGRWYLAPFVPGLGIFMAGQAKQAGTDGVAAWLFFAALPALVFLAIWLVNLRVAAKLRQQIARLDSYSND